MATWWCLSFIQDCVSVSLSLSHFQTSTCLQVTDTSSLADLSSFSDDYFGYDWLKDSPLNQVMAFTNWVGVASSMALQEDGK